MSVTQNQQDSLCKKKGSKIFDWKLWNVKGVVVVIIIISPNYTMKNLNEVEETEAGKTVAEQHKNIQLTGNKADLNSTLHGKKYLLLYYR